MSSGLYDFGTSKNLEEGAVPKPRANGFDAGVIPGQATQNISAACSVVLGDMIFR